MTLVMETDLTESPLLSAKTAPYRNPLSAFHSLESKPHDAFDDLSRHLGSLDLRPEPLDFFQKYSPPFQSPPNSRISSPSNFDEYRQNTYNSQNQYLQRPPNSAYYFGKSYSPIPPPGYICKLCFIEGHWLRNCSMYRERKRENQQYQAGLIQGLTANPASATALLGSIASPISSANTISNPSSASSSFSIDQQQRLNFQQQLLLNRFPFKATIPPDGYICRKCNTPGHWIQQCPHQKVSIPPNTYTCRICGIKGHWIYQCSQRVPRLSMMDSNVEINNNHNSPIIHSQELSLSTDPAYEHYASSAGGLGNSFRDPSYIPCSNGNIGGLNDGASLAAAAEFPDVGAMFSYID